jgi:two-component system sensor kinase
MAIGDSHALAWSLDAWSRATGGRIPRELVDVARSRARDLQTRVAVAQADGVRLIGEGRLDEAAAVLEEARRLTMKEGFFYELNTPVLTYLTTARRMQAERASVWAPRERQRRIARARRVAEHTISVARKFRFNLPHALREAALLAAMSDEPAEARARINESIALAREQGQRYELAQSRVVRAELASALGWPTHGDELAGARAEQAAIEAAAHSAAGPPDEAEGTTRVTLSLIDRFDAILEGGRDVATALTAEAVYSQTRRAALRLLRGERCAVLERSPVGDDFELIPAHGDIGVAASKGVVHRAFETGRTVALSAAEALEDETSRWSGTRSIVCIPIRVRGAPRACLYVTHGSIDDLFGDDELRIGDFLGTAAGAALENAEGFRRLEDLSRELEARVERRTAELATANQELTESLRRVQEAQGQLVHAGKMAAVGTLVAGLSHELNNPLGVVLGYVQVLLRQIPDDTPIREPLLVIERQALRCSRLAKALLEFSRTKPATSIRTDPATVCASVVELALAEARGHAVELREQLPSSPLPEIVVSTHELESALINLVSNALDATPAGGTVLVEAHAETRDEIPGVTFAVSDTGSGIPSTVLPHIFDPFYTTKPVGAGTGLGLSITHQIVTTHGGKIDVKTAEETGTTITIWIPLDSDEPEAARAGKERSPGSGDGVGRQEPRQPS